MEDLAAEGMTMVVVTHEMGFARKAADRMLFMSDGALVEEGSPEDFFERPKEERLRTFLGQIIGVVTSRMVPTALPHKP